MEAAAGIWAGLGSGEAVWELRCGEVCCTWGRAERGRPTLSTGERRETLGRLPPPACRRVELPEARRPAPACRRIGARPLLGPSGAAPHHAAAAGRCEWSRSKQREWEEELCVLDKGRIVFFLRNFFSTIIELQLTVLINRGKQCLQFRKPGEHAKLKK